MSNVTNEQMLRHDRAAASQTPGREAEQARSRSQQEAEATKQQVSEAAGSAKTQANELKHAVAAQASHAAQDARNAAVEAGQRLRSQGWSMIARQKNAAVEELTHLRDALNAASEKLREEDDRRIADCTHVAADRLDAVAEYLRSRDLDNLASDLTQVARRRPVLFYGSLFMTGLAASRFLKASAHRGSHQGQSSPYQGQSSSYQGQSSSYQGQTSSY